jgi:hypothetical protein
MPAPPARRLRVDSEDLVALTDNLQQRRRGEVGRAHEDRRRGRLLRSVLPLPFLLARRLGEFRTTRSRFSFDR